MHTRKTRTKELVARALATSDVPMNIGEVYTAVKTKYPQTAYSTVYRIILGLQKQRKLVTIDWRERGNRFEWADRAHHHHLVCNACGEVEDISDEALHLNTSSIASKTGFTIQDHSVELFGLCESCTGGIHE